MVAHGRRHSPADINGAAFAPPSPKIAIAVAFLQNTLEQAMVAVFVNLALLLTVRDVAVPFVLCAVALFSIGRITFILGYGKGAGGRAFGMVLTVLPSLLFFVWTLTAVTLEAIS
ncbi:ribosomal protein L11 [Asticcacaulis biprosthecium C19]|uniref:Ribosomal protein L11 n=2 Tax=Asticcacaulis biprosthecium TaxID=76891 RepID=F4QG56_9CAUL|nr:ribosomal protein L11 [Asticcacaulis biprosthecium C19]